MMGSASTVVVVATALAALAALPVAAVLGLGLAPGHGDVWTHIAATVLPGFLANTIALVALVGAGVALVYFDGAPAGHSGIRSLGTIKAHFVRLGQTADSAIRARLLKMGRAAQNWTVVSSDHEVQSAARAARAESMNAEEFVKLLGQARRSAPKPGEEGVLSKRELEEWLGLFAGGSRGDERSAKRKSD